MNYLRVVQVIVRTPSLSGFNRRKQWVWPIVQMRKTLTAAQMAERALLAPQEKQQQEMGKYGSRRKTLVVDLTTLVVLLSWMYFPQFSCLYSGSDLAIYVLAFWSSAHWVYPKMMRFNH